jgi:hypothetical protein
MVFLARQTHGADAGTFYAMRVMKKTEIINNKHCELVYRERLMYETIKDALLLVRLHCAFHTRSKLFLITDS